MQTDDNDDDSDGLYLIFHTLYIYLLIQSLHIYACKKYGNPKITYAQSVLEISI